MADDIAPLIKINGLKRRRAERDLAQHASIIKKIETQIQSLELKGQDARQSLISKTGQRTADDATLLADFRALELWEVGQDARIAELRAHLKSLDPELTRLKEALKVLIVREDTLSALSAKARVNRRQTYEQKSAQATQDLWITLQRKGG